MDSPRKRPWNRLHWMTWVSMVVMASAFISRQVEKEHILGIGNLGVFSDISALGWPFQHADLVESAPMVMTPSGLTVQPVTDKEYEWFVWQLAANCSVGLVFVVSTAFVCETFLRRMRRVQFGLRAMLIAIGILGILMALSRTSIVGYRDWDRESFQMEWSVIGWSDAKNPLRWPVVFGLACTIYSLGWLSLALLRRAYCLVRP